MEAKEDSLLIHEEVLKKLSILAETDVSKMTESTKTEIDNIALAVVDTNIKPIRSQVEETKVRQTKAASALPKRPAVKA